MAKADFESDLITLLQLSLFGFLCIELIKGKCLKTDWIHTKFFVYSTLKTQNFFHGGVFVATSANQMFSQGGGAFTEDDYGLNIITAALMGLRRCGREGRRKRGG